MSDANERSLAGIDAAYDSIKDDPTACRGCLGSGKVANDDEGAPWPVWEAMVPPTNIAVSLGLVQPVKCERCGGTGRSDRPDGDHTEAEHE